MNLRGKTIVVTGGGNGIGAALCRRFAAEGARRIVSGDLDAAAAEKVAREIGDVAVGLGVDVADESQVRDLVARAGDVDLFCSNAGISVTGGLDVTDADWERIWGINVKAHLYAARAVIPGMLARGGGYLLHTVSAAGLLTQIGSAPYSVTKHAALALAEWLAITYGDRGIKVSCLCPQGVRTNMLLRADGPGNFLLPGSLSVEEVADVVVQGLADERFLILPHPEVAEYFRRKASDYDRWLRGMRRLQSSVAGPQP
jgi:NAD(P)-dependent dehydrogenase (short-subunit alcohol dehydrogenase family)